MSKMSFSSRARQPPSASVAVRLHNGRALEDSQVEAIVHLVASSVPELETGRITVVDQKGRLLSGNSESREMKLSATQLKIKPLCVLPSVSIRRANRLRYFHKALKPLSKPWRIQL